MEWNVARIAVSDTCHLCSAYCRQGKNVPALCYFTLVHGKKRVLKMFPDSKTLINYIMTYCPRVTSIKIL